MSELNARQAWLPAAVELPNDCALADGVDREAFLRRLAMSLRMAARQNLCVGLLMLQLPAAPATRHGDPVGRLRRLVRVTDCVAQLDAQTCVVLFEVAHAEGAQCASEKLCRALQGEHVPNAGLAVFPEDAPGVELLWQLCEQLFERSCATQGGLLRVEAAAGEVLREARLDLAEALRHHDLQVFYQPIMNLRSALPTALEAVARWQHPQWGVLEAAEFMPCIVTHPDFETFNYRMLEQALAQIQAWRQAGLSLRLAANFSPRLLAAPDCRERILASLAAAGLAPGVLTLELGESLLAELAPAVRHTLFALAAAGVCLCLEVNRLDEATALALRELPTEVIKLDRRLVARLGEDGASTGCVQALLSLGRSLGRIVVATGIERAEQLDLLRTLGCEYGEGWHLGEPMAAGEVARWLRRRLGECAARGPDEDFA